MTDRFEEFGVKESDKERLSKDQRENIRSIVEDVLETPMERAQGFDWEEYKRNESFKAIMAPYEQVWIMGKFERSFTQAVGENVYEKFAVILADSCDDYGEAEQSHSDSGQKVSPEQQSVIDTIVEELAANNRDPNWNEEVEQVLNAGGEPTYGVSKLTWDVWIEDFDGNRPLALEIKTPKPNKDQTKAAKRKMLQTVAAYSHSDDPVPIPRFAFPFNPYGSVEEYNHWPAKAIFDIGGDGILVADDFWDTVGGQPHTGDALKSVLIDECEGNIKQLRNLSND